MVGLVGRALGTDCTNHHGINTDLVRLPRTLPSSGWEPSVKRVIAVDWSGAKARAQHKIWLAEVCGGRLTRLESGRDRREVVQHLIDEADRDPEMVVGLDFAFSFPRWFAEGLGATSVEEVWDRVATQGEEWLRDCPDPFFGKRGSRRPEHPKLFRLTEHRASSERRATPKSVFQIAGPGAVGTGSIRGMPCLTQLRDAGFSVWPFHEPRTMPAVPAALVIEIYPRLLTGDVIKSSFDERRKRLTTEYYPEMDSALACKAASSEDAFDAAVSAVVMSRHVAEIGALTASRDPTELIEGRIWWPQEMRKPGVGVAVGAVPQDGCSFCEIPKNNVVAETRHAVAIPDGYPVNRGHTLVVPKAHVKSLFDLDNEAQADVWRLVAKMRSDLQSQLNPDGFNVGLNDGRAAGQTVEHAHVHVIPRFDGDAADPRGGIRWVMPECAAYWDR